MTLVDINVGQERADGEELAATGVGKVKKRRRRNGAETLQIEKGNNAKVLRTTPTLVPKCAGSLLKKAAPSVSHTFIYPSRLSEAASQRSQSGAMAGMMP